MLIVYVHNHVESTNGSFRRKSTFLGSWYWIEIFKGKNYRQLNVFCECMYYVRHIIGNPTPRKDMPPSSDLWNGIMEITSFKDGNKEKKTERTVENTEELCQTR